MQYVETRTHLNAPPVHKTRMLHVPRYSMVKRVADLVLVGCLLLLLSLPMLLIAISIKLYSPGPIFYRQKRIGKNGKPFTMLKFRSMHVGNDNDIHRLHVQRLIRENTRPEDIRNQSLKLKGDPRVTGIGKTLRSLGLDELPQFFNVMRGEMSLVGPRPPLPYEYELYDDWHKQRLSVVPGITGLWQVTAHNTVSFEEMVRIDLDYIQSMSPLLDLRIMVQTPLEMLKGSGGG